DLEDPPVSKVGGEEVSSIEGQAEQWRPEVARSLEFFASWAQLYDEAWNIKRRNVNPAVSIGSDALGKLHVSGEGGEGGCLPDPYSRGGYPEFRSPEGYETQQHGCQH